MQDELQQATKTTQQQQAQQHMEQQQQLQQQSKRNSQKLARTQSNIYKIKRLNPAKDKKQQLQQQHLMQETRQQSQQQQQFYPHKQQLQQQQPHEQQHLNDIKQKPNLPHEMLSASEQHNAAKDKKTAKATEIISTKSTRSQKYKTLAKNGHGLNKRLLK